MKELEECIKDYKKMFEEWREIYLDVIGSELPASEEKVFRKLLKKYGEQKLLVMSLLVIAHYNHSVSLSTGSSTVTTSLNYSSDIIHKYYGDIGVAETNKVSEKIKKALSDILNDRTLSRPKEIESIIYEIYTYNEDKLSSIVKEIVVFNALTLFLDLNNDIAIRLSENLVMANFYIYLRDILNSK